MAIVKITQDPRGCKISVWHTKKDPGERQSVMFMRWLQVTCGNKLELQEESGWRSHHNGKS